MNRSICLLDAAGHTLRTQFDPYDDDDDDVAIARARAEAASAASVEAWRQSRLMVRFNRRAPASTPRKK